MALDIFKKRFGKDPKEFNTIEEMYDFVEEKTGRKLEVVNLKKITRKLNTMTPFWIRIKQLFCIHHPEERISSIWVICSKCGKELRVK